MMFEFTDDHLMDILSLSYDTSSCQFRYVLRNMLCRGAEEANFLSFQFSGKVAEAFRRDKIFLEGIVSDLHFMLDREGNVRHRYCAAIRKAVTRARYLIAIERAQTASQLNMLDKRLRSPRHREDCSNLKAA